MHKKQPCNYELWIVLILMNHISFSKDLPNAHSTLAYIIKVKSHVSNLLAPYIFMQFASPSLSYSYVYHHFKKRFKTSSALSFVTTTDPKLEPTYIGMYHHDTNNTNPNKIFLLLLLWCADGDLSWILIFVQHSIPLLWNWRVNYFFSTTPMLLIAYCVLCIHYPLNQKQLLSRKCVKNYD